MTDGVVACRPIRSYLESIPGCPSAGPAFFQREGLEGEEPNEEGLRFYEEVFKECKKYNIEPLVTLFHFDNPVYVAVHYNGWHSRKTIDCFLRYAKEVFTRYQGLVKYWKKAIDRKYKNTISVYANGIF